MINYGTRHESGYGLDIDKAKARIRHDLEAHEEDWDEEASSCTKLHPGVIHDLWHDDWQRQEDAYLEDDYNEAEGNRMMERDMKRHHADEERKEFVKSIPLWAILGALIGGFAGALIQSDAALNFAIGGAVTSVVISMIIYGNQPPK